MYKAPIDVFYLTDVVQVLQDRHFSAVMMLNFIHCIVPLTSRDDPAEVAIMEQYFI